MSDCCEGVDVYTARCRGESESCCGGLPETGEYSKTIVVMQLCL